MEFFLFLLYNQENSREKYFPAKRGEINMKGTSCEYCANYTYDEECDEYYCDVNLDEDEYYRFVSSDYKECPYYRSGDGTSSDVIQSNGKNRAEDNAIRQMRVFHEKECEFCGKSAF